MVFSADELAYADEIGRARQKASGHLVAGHGLVANETEAENYNILGARGEKAVSKLLGIPWERPLWRHKRGGDIGPYQVRTRRGRSQPLILRPDDDERDTYILVVPTVRIVVMLVVGWIICADGMRLEWVRAPGGRPPAWFVPQSVLQPFPIR